MRRLAAVALLFLFCVPSAGAWTWPVEGPVLAPFTFDAAHPYAAGQHRGIDIGAPSDATVVAPAAGTVTFAGTVPTSGKTLSLLTGDSLAVTLTHLGSLAVAKGALVAEGAAVGTVGPSGTPELDTPYVHLGVRTASDEQGYLDPVSFLPPLMPPAPPAAPPAAAAPAAPAVTPPETAPAPAPAPAPAAPAPADSPAAPQAETAAQPSAQPSAPAPAPAPTAAPVDIPAPPPMATTPAPAEPTPPAPATATAEAPAPGTAPAAAPAFDPAAPTAAPAVDPAAPAAAPAFDPAAPTPAPVAESDVLSGPAVPPGTALAPDATPSELPPLQLFGVRPHLGAPRPGTRSAFAAARVPLVAHGAAEHTADHRAHRVAARALPAATDAPSVRGVRELPTASTPLHVRVDHGLPLALLVVAALAVAALLARMIRSPFPRSEGASTVREDPRRPRLAVCERPAPHRPRGGLRRAGGRVRALPPAEGRRRPHGERHGRARHARDGVRGPERRVAA